MSGERKKFGLSSKFKLNLEINLLVIASQPSLVQGPAGPMPRSFDCSSTAKIKQIYTKKFYKFME